MAGFHVPSGTITKGKSRAAHSPIRLDFRRFGTAGGPHVTEHIKFTHALNRVADLHSLLLEGKSELLMDNGVAMTGWKMESPFITEAELDTIIKHGQKLAKLIDDLVSIGIGGSYLGNRATLEALYGPLELFNLLSAEERGNIPRQFFLGNHMSPGYTARVLQILSGRSVGVNVISKSGGTVEPAIAFAILKEALEHSYPDAASRIVAVTDRSRGALKELADEKGYATYVVPDNVGGRFSVTSPVGLFGLAVAGVDIKEFIAGAKFAEEMTRERPAEKNIAMLRAVMRYIAHVEMLKKIEVASTGIHGLKGVTMWMQQLGPESEGKNGQGLWISPEFYTEMAHANGQMIQMGERNMIETFLMVEDTGLDVKISAKGTPVSYLDGKKLSSVNQAFIDGLRDAHYEGGVPTMSYILPRIDAFTLGQFYQLEMNTIALSGLLLGQNPHIQPGVQKYKDVANARSGKPGTEAALADMMQAEKKLDPKFIV